MSEARPSLYRSTLSLGLVAVLGTALLSAVNQLTAGRIAEQERRVVLEQLGQIIPPDRYDNELQDDWFAFSDATWFPQGQQVVAYRARRDGQPVAVISRSSSKVIVDILVARDTTRGSVVNTPDTSV